ncbi:CheR methyltransferase, SAM binding domain protein [Desulfamplus magnetovallimortis]|uniref:protein-glutamate O-methyltransferase n=1 Tax=Desulfamplus magnetovallimortis TaxID=1246637 RepID=A0A1W1HGU2_9BACT|nr:CheR family methyltransferase [Desulfamplus magnetovallimortis]SLM31643.1 CheR methyltransferase, SAM binding domain protein [Desulfamplus magnetovallimortis]
MEPNTTSSGKMNTNSSGKQNGNLTFPVIGIGASAGGLEAITEFFSSVPEKSGLSFIVHIHMAAGQPSIVDELLQRKTQIPVTIAKDGETLRHDHIYITPPGMEISLFKDTIQLFDINGGTPSLPIDFFFRSLAEDKKECCAGVILSGTGSDGTLGIKEIKLREGLTVVQSEETAKYNGMPGSAIKTGIIDLVLPPNEMPEKIVHYFRCRQDICSDQDKDKAISSPEHDSETVLSRKNDCETIQNHENDKEPLARDYEEYYKRDHHWLKKIYALLRSNVGHDFSSYKKSTILRRINRRMHLNQIESHDAYIQLMRENPEETDSLFRELLIGVTSFFRDKESFDILKNSVFNSMLEGMEEDSVFRIWIPGCSTGEEAYSIAMVLRECIDAIPKRINLQLFGTDIDQYAIEKAREGIYTVNIAADVSKDRLKRFFIREGEFFRIRKEIRDCVIFSIQDLLRDPPFSRLNLLCCRNLLIYLDGEAQKKLLPLFHYTLSPGGVLLLGSSETIGQHANFFEIVNPKWKIFRKKELPREIRPAVEFPTGNVGVLKGSGRERVLPMPAGRNLDIAHLTRRIILDEIAPTTILIDRDGRMLHVQGRTGKFLEQVSGRPSTNILEIPREGLGIELSSAIRQAVKSNQNITRKGIQVKTNGEFQIINLHVRPLSQPDELSGYLLVIFEEVPLIPIEEGIGHQEEEESSEKLDIKTEANYKKRILELEREIQRSREGHQTTLEELESSNEELKSINEEMQSANEELQSTNEELESSKEELQSLNEELQTVNSELQSKVDELSSAQDDMRNLLNSTEIATIFVDNGIRLKRYTQEAVKLVNFIPTDIGRPLKHVVNNLKYDRMIQDVKDVLDKLIPKEVEVKTINDQWFKMRIMPYRTTDNRIEGAVLTFFDINEQKRMLKEIQKKQHKQ